MLFVLRNVVLRKLAVVLTMAGIAIFARGCASPAVPARDMAEMLSGATFTRQGDYVISANDQVAVRVYGQDALTGNYTVSASGVLTFPLVGFVQAAGSTSLQVTERLQKALTPFVRSPIVTVSITNRDSFQVYFSGEINKPGAVTLQSRTTLLQGLAVGGGLANGASGRIVVLRQAQNGSVQRFATTYRKLLTGQGDVDRVVLERGDVVHAE